MKELKLGRATGMGLLGKTELYKILDATLQLSAVRALSLEFTYNVDLGSLSISFIRNEEVVYWYLFQDEKLNKAKLKKLKESITESVNL